MNPTESLGSEQSPSHLPFLPVAPPRSPVAPSNHVLHSPQKTRYTQVIAKLYQTGDTKTGVGQQLFLTITCPLWSVCRREERPRRQRAGFRVGFPVLVCEQLCSGRGQFADSGAILGSKMGTAPPGDLGARSPGSLFLLHSNATAVNCRVWCLCHIRVEASTCDKATRVPLPAHPTGSHFVATVPLGTCGHLRWACAWYPGCHFSSPARACSVVGCFGGLFHVVCAPFSSSKDIVSPRESH